MFLFQTIHAFVGSVALAGAEDGLWAIEGGNWKLVEKLLEVSNATIIDAKVKKQLKLGSRYQTSVTNSGFKKLNVFFWLVWWHLVAFIIIIHIYTRL